MLQASTKKKQAYVYFFGKPERRDSFEELGIDESILTL